jgi:hypothetical protein
LLGQFPAQLTVVLLHVSGIVPQNPAWHVGAMQLWHVVALQNCPFAHVSPQSVFLLPHRFHTVPQCPTHSGGGGHVPQCSFPPHPSGTSPQTPGAHCVSGMQPHVCDVVLHVFPPVQPPQLIVPVCPQPTANVPHFAAQSAKVSGLHVAHVCVFASQTSALGHVPQLTGTLHESVTNPHVAPAAAHSWGMVLHRWVASSHASFGVHRPHSTIWPQLSIGPHAPAPITLHRLATQPSPVSAPSGRNSPPESVSHVPLSSPVDPSSPVEDDPSSPEDPSPVEEPSSPPPVVASCPPPASPPLGGPEPSLFVEAS